MLSIDNGFQEAVAIVADDALSAGRLSRALGYDIRYQGHVPEGALALLGIGSERRATETLIGHPDLGRGDIRLLSLDGPPADLMRDGAQAWDTGGIFDINIRALAGGIEPLHRALGAAGFVAHSPVVAWDFGPLSVKEIVERDADGLCIALMERVAPPLSGYEAVGGPASWVFNSTQVVPDFDAARRLYVDALGWQIVQETEGFVADASGLNCMGLPPGLAPTIPMRIGIYQPLGRMEGSIEIVWFGCGGYDFSAAAPPGRGWTGLRFLVGDVDGVSARLADAGCVLTEPVMFDWQPHGMVRAVAARTPWGARLEALERC